MTEDHSPLRGFCMAKIYFVRMWTKANHNAKFEDCVNAHSIWTPYRLAGDSYPTLFMSYCHIYGSWHTRKNSRTLVQETNY